MIWASNLNVSYMLLSVAHVTFEARGNTDTSQTEG